MTKQKQIEEMANILYGRQDEVDLTDPYTVAEALYNAGYRKQDEVLKRVAEELKDFVWAGYVDGEWCKYIYAEAIDEVLKEYLCNTKD